MATKRSASVSDHMMWTDGNGGNEHPYAPPLKKRKHNVTLPGFAALAAKRASRCDEEERVERGPVEESRDGTDDTTDERREGAAVHVEVPVAAARAPVAVIPTPSPSPPSTATAVDAPVRGVVLRTGRIRLPDKLMEYLNNNVAPKSLFWQPDGQGFSIDCNTVQAELLDKHFHGSKLSSFLRSLNRWGFKRLFYHSMPSSTLSFHNPLFRKDSPHLSKEMNMAPAESGKKGKGSKKQAKKAKVQEAKKTEAAPTAVGTPKAQPVPQVPVTMVTQATPSLVTMPPQQAVQVAPEQPLSATLPPVATAATTAATNPLQTLGSIIAQSQGTQLLQAEAQRHLLLQSLAARQQAQQVHVQPQPPSITLDVLESVLSQLAAQGVPLNAASPQLASVANMIATLMRPAQQQQPLSAPLLNTMAAPANVTAHATLLRLLSPAQQLELLQQGSATGNVSPLQQQPQPSTPF